MRQQHEAVTRHGVRELSVYEVHQARMRHQNFRKEYLRRKEHLRRKDELRAKRRPPNKLVAGVVRCHDCEILSW